jgi:hypothetical protein
MLERFQSERDSFERLLEIALAQPGERVSLLVSERETPEVVRLAKRTHVTLIVGDKKRVMFSVDGWNDDLQCVMKGYMFVTPNGVAPPDTAIFKSLDKDDLRAYEWRYEVIGDGWFLYRSCPCD